MAGILLPENLPFAVSLAIVMLLALMQVIGVSHLFPDPDFDAPDIDIDASAGPDMHADIDGGLVSLMGLGKLPLIVWLSFFLASFGLIGISIQALATSILGAPLSPWLAGGAALAATLPVNAVVTNFLSKIWPRDETTAVHKSSLVGRRCRIAIGRAEANHPARAIVHDYHGQMHNIMVEPHNADAAFVEGQEVLLVRREGEIFYAIDDRGEDWLADGRVNAPRLPSP